MPDDARQLNLRRLELEELCSQLTKQRDALRERFNNPDLVTDLLAENTRLKARNTTLELRLRSIRDIVAPETSK